MTLFEYLQTCSIEEFAEFLVKYRIQTEEGILKNLKKKGISITLIEPSQELKMLSVIQELTMMMD